MQVIITPQAEKQYNRLPTAEKTKIKRKLLLLQESPREGKKLSGSLVETRSLKTWPYRIVYWIDEKHKKLFIITIAHRQGVYK